MTESPMNYWRVVNRNFLRGDGQSVPIQKQAFDQRPMIRDDLRKMEVDQRDEDHLAAYARRAGITKAQAKQVLDDFFASQDVLFQRAECLHPEADRRRMLREAEGSFVKLQRYLYKHHTAIPKNGGIVEWAIAALEAYAEKPRVRHFRLTELSSKALRDWIGQGDDINEVTLHVEEDGALSVSISDYPEEGAMPLFTPTAAAPLDARVGDDRGGPMPVSPICGAAPNKESP